MWVGGVKRGECSSVAAMLCVCVAVQQCGSGSVAVAEHVCVRGEKGRTESGILRQRVAVEVLSEAVGNSHVSRWQ